MGLNRPNLKLSKGDLSDAVGTAHIIFHSEDSVVESLRGLEAMPYRSYTTDTA